MDYEVEITEKALEDLASLYAPGDVPSVIQDCFANQLRYLAADPIGRSDRPIFPQPGGGQMYYFTCQEPVRRDFAALFVYGDDEATLFVLRFMTLPDALHRPQEPPFDL